jgi:hypothetical protein
MREKLTNCQFKPSDCVNENKLAKEGQAMARVATYLLSDQTIRFQLASGFTAGRSNREQNYILSEHTMRF